MLSGLKKQADTLSAQLGLDPDYLGLAGVHPLTSPALESRPELALNHMVETAGLKTVLGNYFEHKGLDQAKALAEKMVFEMAKLAHESPILLDPKDEIYYIPVPSVPIDEEPEPAIKEVQYRGLGEPEEPSSEEFQGGYGILNPGNAKLVINA